MAIYVFPNLFLTAGVHAAAPTRSPVPTQLDQGGAESNPFTMVCVGRHMHKPCHVAMVRRSQQALCSACAILFHHSRSHQRPAAQSPRPRYLDGRTPPPPPPPHPRQLPHTRSTRPHWCRRRQLTWPPRLGVPCPAWRSRRQKTHSGAEPRRPQCQTARPLSPRCAGVIVSTQGLANG
jgi:hypothetical protein